ncbi:MAG: hypothetical protein GF375_05705, partial [Candidatus Omnitrophica bacterium]|nr:hypothetical protein [Candidatus Omnitrophota bacterium]MBD3269478.1 hypothetical protein [Candidatus Omnitrophota bacterium]
MIVKMRQLTILVTKESIDSALVNLRRLGVVHISHLKAPQADYIDRVKRNISRTDRALKIIGESEKQEKLEEEELISASKEIVEIDRRKSKLKNELSELESKSNWFKDWGEVSKKDFEELAYKNIFIRLYICGKKDFEKIKKDNLVYIINRKGPTLGIARITTEAGETLNFREVEVPPENADWFGRRIASLKEDIEKTERKLAGFAAYRDCFVKYKNNLLKKFEFIKVKFGMGRAESLAWLKGYCPLDSIEGVKETAGKKGWGIIIQKPENLGEVPTLLRNPRWIDIIKPVFNFMGTLPGYKEYDISFWFLLFFSLFFAMLIGDAGYGIVFLVATYLLRRKFKTAPVAPFFLIYVLAASTVIWGALSGTWFGSESIAKFPFFNFLIIDRINSFVQSNQSFMIYL